MGELEGELPQLLYSGMSEGPDFYPVGFEEQEAKDTPAVVLTRFRGIFSAGSTVSGCSESWRHKMSLKRGILGLSG